MELEVELVEFGLELLPAPGQAPQGGLGGGGGAGEWPGRRAAPALTRALVLSRAAVGAAPQGRCPAPRTAAQRPRPEPSWRRGGPPVAAGSSRPGPHGSWGGRSPPRPGSPGGGLSIDRVRLAALPPHAGVRPSHLNHRQPIGGHEPGQAGPEGAGPFDPDAPPPARTPRPRSPRRHRRESRPGTLGASSRPVWSMTAATCWSRWVSTRP